MQNHAKSCVMHIIAGFEVLFMQRKDDVKMVTHGGVDSSLQPMITPTANSWQIILEANKFASLYMTRFRKERQWTEIFYKT